MIQGQRNCFCKIKLSKSLWSFLLSAKLESQRCISRKTNACTLTESMDTGQRPQKSWYYVNVSFSWYRCIVEDHWRQYIKEYKGSALHWIVDEEEQPQWKVGRDEGSREWNINVHERVRCPDLCKGHWKHTARCAKVWHGFKHCIESGLQGGKWSKKLTSVKYYSLALIIDSILNLHYDSSLKLKDRKALKLTLGWNMGRIL